MSIFTTKGMAVSSVAMVTAPPILAPWHRVGPLVLTIARGPLALVVTLGVLAGGAWVPAIALATFVVLDLLDGEWARRDGAVDAGVRRMLDSVTDRSAVTAAFVASAIVEARLWPIALALLALNVAALSVCLRPWALSRTIVVAPKWHRVWSSTLAVAGFAFLSGNVDVALGLGALGTLLAIACTAEVLREYRRQRPI